MKETLVPIDQAGRVVLPKSVRDELAIKPGDLLRVSIHGTDVTLTPKQSKSGFERKGQALVFSSGDETLKRETVGEILAAQRESRGNEVTARLPARKRK